MKTTDAIEFEEQLDKLRGIWRATEESARATGIQILEMEKRWPDSVARIARKCGEFNADLLDALKQLAAGKLRWDVLVSPSPAAKKMRRYPIQEQNDLAVNGVIVLRKERGEFKQFRVPFGCVKARDVAIALNGKGRNPPQIQESLIDQRAKEEKIRKTQRWQSLEEGIQVNVSPTIIPWDEVGRLFNSRPRPSFTQLESTIKKNQIAK